MTTIRIKLSGNYMFSPESRGKKLLIKKGTMVDGKIHDDLTTIFSIQKYGKLYLHAIKPEYVKNYPELQSFLTK